MAKSMANTFRKSMAKSMANTFRKSSRYNLFYI